LPPITLMPLDEILDSLREVPQLQIAAQPDLPGDISGHIPRPAFHCVESEDPDRIIVLAVEQVLVAQPSR
jgi:hypothetical protein